MTTARSPKSSLKVCKVFASSVFSGYPVAVNINRDSSDLPFTSPNPDTGCTGLVVNMENQQHFYATQDKVENQLRFHERGEQSDPPLAASLKDGLGNGDP